MSFAKYILLAMCLFTSSIALRIDVKREVTKQTPTLPEELTETEEGWSMGKYKPDHLPLGEGCEKPESPKVAILVAGLGRGMVHPDTSAAFQKHVLQYLKAKGARGLNRDTPDVFVNVKSGTGPAAVDRRHASHETSVTSEQLNETMAEMEATDSNFEEGDGTQFEQQVVRRKDCFKFNNHHSHLSYMASTWHSIEGVVNLMKKHEEKFGSYDMVVYQRPDKLWNRQLDYSVVREGGTLGEYAHMDSMSLTCVRAWFHGDQFATMPRAAANLLGDLFKDNALTDNPTICHPHNPEQVFQALSIRLNKEGICKSSFSGCPECLREGSKAKPKHKHH